MTDTRAESPAPALRWITTLLREAGMPYQVAGDVAAVAHGARPVGSAIEIFIAAADVPSLLRLVSDQVAGYPWRVRDESWDRVRLALAYHGEPIEVAVADAARLRDHRSGEWIEAAVCIGASVPATVWGVDITVMPRAQLIDQKRCLDRETDRREIEQMRAAP